MKSLVYKCTESVPLRLSALFQISKLEELKFLYRKPRETQLEFAQRKKTPHTHRQHSNNSLFRPLSTFKIQLMKKKKKNNNHKGTPCFEERENHSYL